MFVRRQFSDVRYKIVPRCHSHFHQRTTGGVKYTHSIAPYFGGSLLRYQPSRVSVHARHCATVSNILQSSYLLHSFVDCKKQCAPQFVAHYNICLELQRRYTGGI